MDRNNLGIYRFLSLSSIQLYRNNCTETLQTPTFKDPLAGVGMDGTKEIERQNINNIHRISYFVV